MILVDTSVWIDHLRVGSARLADLLARGGVLGHPCVAGELSLGNLRNRAEILALLRQLPQAVVAEHDETCELIAREQLHGHGIGYVDAQLLAACRLTPGAALWTTDRRLAAVADRLRLTAAPA